MPTKYIAHYTHEKPIEILSLHGFAVDEVAYIVGSELIMPCRKRDHLKQNQSSGLAKQSSFA